MKNISFLEYVNNNFNGKPCKLGFVLNRFIAKKKKK